MHYFLTFILPAGLGVFVGGGLYELWYSRTGKPTPTFRSGVAQNVIWLVILYVVVTAINGPLVVAGVEKPWWLIALIGVVAAFIASVAQGWLVRRWQRSRQRGA